MYKIQLDPGPWAQYVKRADNIGLPLHEVTKKYIMESNLYATQLFEALQSQQQSQQSAVAAGAGVGAPTATPTPTPTPTPAGSATPTPTATSTPTPTPTPIYQAFSLGFNALSSGSACTSASLSPSTYYGYIVSGSTLDLGEILFTDTALTATASNGYYSTGSVWYSIIGSDGVIASSGSCA